MKILVIGGRSFSGKAFTAYVRNLGIDARALSRPEFDLRQPGSLVGDLVRYGGYDTVVNFAALNMVGESWQNAGDYYETNVAGAARLATDLRESGIRRFVQISTPEIYGTMNAFLKESAPINPTTPYAISRAACDMHLKAMHRQYGFPVCFTRSVNVYGPEQPLYRIIPKTAMCILLGRKLELHGGGVSTRSFMHIKDVSEGVLLVATDGEPGETYHTSTSDQTSIRSLVQKICDRLDARFEDVVVDVEERPGKDMAYQLDSSKIREQLGWSDRISLDEGLDETVSWVKANFNQLKQRPLDYEHRA